MAAIDALNRLHGEALIARLPRTPGRKDSEYMHLSAVRSTAWKKMSLPGPNRRPLSSRT